MAEPRRFPIGAEPLASGGTHFRVWAPRRQNVAVVPEGGKPVELLREAGGYFAGTAAIAPGGLYRFRLDGGDHLFPDPASRYQPHGPHGPSQVIDSRAFPWTDASWVGVAPADRVVYELHVGTFTPEGTWEAAARQLPEL